MKPAAYTKDNFFDEISCEAIEHKLGTASKAPDREAREAQVRVCHIGSSALGFRGTPSCRHPCTVGDNVLSNLVLLIRAIRRSGSTLRPSVTASSRAPAMATAAAAVATVVEAGAVGAGGAVVEDSKHH